MNTSKNAEITSLLILGSSGKLGSMLAEKFKLSGFNVVGLDVKQGSDSFLDDFIHADINDPATSRKLSASHFDVLVVAIPFDPAESFSKDIILLSGKSCLVVDFLSEKVLFERLIKESDAGISHIGVHLLFAPSVTWKGQNVLVSPATITDERARLFIQQLEKWEVALHYCSAAEHDRLMNVVQVGVHAAVIAYAQFLVDQNVDFELLDKISTPPARTMWAMAARMIENDPSIYWDIQKNNVSAGDARTELNYSLEKLNDMIANDDSSSFDFLFERLSTMFGERKRKYVQLAKGIFEHQIPED